MRIFYKYGLLFITVIALFSFKGFINNSLENKINQSLYRALNVVSEDEKFLVWVDFTDKGNNPEKFINTPERLLTPKAIERRELRGTGELVDFTDIPVKNEYIDGVKNYGLEIKNVSKWFNSVSCYATKLQIEQLAREDFVKKIELVARFKTNIDYKKDLIIEEKSGSTNYFQNDNPSTLNYGGSFHQSDLINVPIGHDSGYTGKGVLIACFDTGFDNLEHPCFDSIRARGLRTYDFVNGDTNVANEPGQMGEGSHGTRVLSLIVGYGPGNLISPAFDSRVILAKTENTDSETPVEEDNWIAAAEWADSLGADIISSSLIYREFDPGSPYSYDWTWMNGDSCKITIGADLIVGKGIVVVNAAGNNGFDPNHNTLGAPADGDSVITIGSIDPDGLRSSFSSVGPTVDGRNKPDLMAMGRDNVTAEFGSGSTGYTSFGSGTSFACPMAAGVVAMIIQANPSLNPIKIRGVLRSTASNSSSPNSLIGWGTINAWNAIQLALTTSIDPVSGNLPDGYTLGQNYPNPFNPMTTIPFAVNRSSTVSLKLYDMSGREVATLLNNASIQPSVQNIQLNTSTLGLSSGVYFYSLILDGVVADTKKMVLMK